MILRVARILAYMILVFPTVWLLYHGALAVFGWLCMTLERKFK
jgi:hypothetical protein